MARNINRPIGVKRASCFWLSGLGCFVLWFCRVAFVISETSYGIYESVTYSKEKRRLYRKTRLYEGFHKEKHLDEIQGVRKGKFTKRY